MVRLIAPAAVSQAVATLGRVTDVDLTAPQADALARSGGFTMVGAAGTGKTTVLLRRYLRRVRDSVGGRVLVVCRNAAASQRFRRAAVPHLAGGFDALSITTIWALAFDIVTHHATGTDQPVLLTASGRRRVLAELLRAEAGDASLWPVLHDIVGRVAFVDAVERGLATFAALDPTDDAHPAGAGDPRLAELTALAGRLAAHCEAIGAIDATSVVQRAARLLTDPAIAATHADRFDEILVDDGETLTPAAAHLLGTLAAATPLVVAVNPAGWAPQPATAALSPQPHVQLDTPFRHPAAPELIECRHPSVEADAIAGELLAAHDRGTAWHDMAVIAPAGRIEAIARATARHNIPAAASLRHAVATDPLTRSIVDLVTWAAGDDDAIGRLLASPLSGLDAAAVRVAQRDARARAVPLGELGELAPLADARRAVARVLEAGDLIGACHEAFRHAARGLVRLPHDPVPPVEERSLDAAVAFLRGLEHFLSHADTPDVDDLARYVDHVAASAEVEVDPWWGHDTGDGSGGDGSTTQGVTLTTVAGAAGREWALVVVAGCVEGTFPRVDGSAGFFDTTSVSGPDAPDDRLLAALDRERRRFVAACGRATGTLLATAAPEPGVLLSRFVAGWPRRGATLPLDAPAAPTSVPESEGTLPVWPAGSLLLSASQLDTYEDCPLKYAFRYAAGVRTEAGLHADLGTVVHDALAEFLDPDSDRPRTLETLLQVADECWRDDIAPYRPQVEEARRDYYDMLEAWWEGEGKAVAAGTIDVVATEHLFEVDVGPHRVTGRIDRVDRTADGTGIRVLDYKTGKSRPRPDDVAANVQLATYYLAARRDDALRVWGDPTELRLLYLRSMKAYDQEVTDEHEAVTETRILDAARRIVGEEFEPSVDADCDHCEFHRLCPLWPEGLEVGER